MWELYCDVTVLQILNLLLKIITGIQILKFSEILKSSKNPYFQVPDGGETLHIKDFI
jgi:hypothetical protein